jgi:hypothetical protein
MNEILIRLGISPEIQAFFNVSSNLDFDYGDRQEHYGEDFHLVPATRNLWMAGNQNANQVIISYSVMEAMAYITLKRQYYPRLEQVAFIAVGCRLHPEQSDWIGQNFKNRKVTLVFGRDLIGNLTDIKLTAGIKNIPVRILNSEGRIQIHKGGKWRVFEQEQISLHAFQEAFSIRPRFRTAKPHNSLTFLDQLKHDCK